MVAALSRNEGFGLTILEAMASGCAVLASRAGAWQDIIDEGIHGYTVPCDDVEATRKGLETLLSSDLRAFAEENRRHVERNYSVHREASALVDYYRSFLPRA